MAAPIAEPPHLAADLKTLCLSTITAQWRPLAEQATRQRQAPADYLAQLAHPGGDRAPGAAHPTPHSGCPFPDAQDARRLLVRRATGPRPRRGPGGLRLRLRRRGRQRRPRRRGGNRQDPSGHRPGNGLLPARLPGAVRDRRRAGHPARRSAATGPAATQARPARPLRGRDPRRAGAMSRSTRPAPTCCSASSANATSAAASW